MKEYNKKNIPLAKELRRNMTPWEQKLWYQFLSKYPVRFQRQKAIGNYIVDFYCAKARLAIELDGGGHYDEQQMKKDTQRTQELEKMGLRVLRICNADVDRKFRSVCEFLDMEIKKSLPQSAALTAPSSEGAKRRKIYALGFFDGVHLGHQALLAACRTLAAQQDCDACAVTFSAHPQSLVTGSAPLLLHTVEDRKRLLLGYGMQQVLVLPFDEKIMKTHWSEFLSALVELDAVGFVCGDDFRFGAGGLGTAKKLEAFCRARGLACAVVPQQTVDGIRISSTHIRQLVAQGDMAQAEKFLGHPYFISGPVTHGRQLGRTMGTPTANILFPEGVAVPKLGVYACTCVLDGKIYRAVTNIGSRPTVEGHQTRAESWVLDFQGDLYGRELTLRLHQFLRPEEKFDSLDALKEQIRLDAEQTEQLLIGSRGDI